MAQTVWNLTASEMAIRLYDEEFVRQIAIGNNWVRIRLLFRWQIFATSNLPFATKLRVGVCKGTTDTFRSTNCLNYAGIDFGGGNGVGWGYTSNYHTCGSPYTGWRPFKKVGNTITTGSGGGTNVCYSASNLTLYPTLFCLTVTRTFGGGFSFNAGAPNGAAMGNLFVNDNTYYRVLEDEQGTTWQDSYMPDDIGVGTVTGLEDDMDTISINWNNGLAPIEITRMSLIRYA